MAYGDMKLSLRKHGKQKDVHRSLKIAMVCSDCLLVSFQPLLVHKHAPHLRSHQISCAAARGAESLKEHKIHVLVLGEENLPLRIMACVAAGCLDPAR